jgi:predicted NBD/HSP70 family sugar kinase
VLRVCGVDLGGTNARFLVADTAGRIRTHRRTRTPRDAAPEAMASWLAGQIERLTDAPPAATVVGLPAAVHPLTGELGTVPNLPRLAGPEFTRALRGLLPGRTVLTNDTNAALAGESAAGAAAGRGSAVMITIGTGVGVAARIDGRPLTGRTGVVGEFAILPYGAGTLEDAISGGGLLGQARAAGFPLDHAGPVFAPDAPPALAAIRDRAYEALEILLTAVTVAYEPEVVVFGGGVERALRPRYGTLQKALAAITPEPPDLVTGALGDRAGAIGALVLGYRALGLDPPAPKEDQRVPTTSA